MAVMDNDTEQSRPAPSNEDATALALLVDAGEADPVDALLRSRCE
jgi:hypothetical protein